LFPSYYFGGGDSERESAGAGHRRAHAATVGVLISSAGWAARGRLEILKESLRIFYPEKSRHVRSALKGQFNFPFSPSMYPFQHRIFPPNKDQPSLPLSFRETLSLFLSPCLARPSRSCPEQRPELTVPSSNPAWCSTPKAEANARCPTCWCLEGSSAGLSNTRTGGGGGNPRYSGCLVSQTKVEILRIDEKLEGSFSQES
jgi:hypothetical protein